MNRQNGSVMRIFLAAALVIICMGSYAQCRSFAKNKCVPTLAPYKFNETFNAAQLAPGEEAEVNLTFYSGQEYRVLVCAHPVIGDVDWKLVDTSGRIVFESKEGARKEHFDLKAADTAQMKVIVTVPERGRTDMVHVGCVGILVGFKE